MRLFLITVIAATTMSFAATSFGAAVKVGEAMESKGRVEVVKPDAVRGTPLRLGSVIEEGDIVRTSSGASTVILLVDGSVLDVGSSSRVKFYELTPDSDSHVDLEKGDVLFEVTPITPIRGTFKIKTTTSIIGVKGTNFRVLASPSSTKITMNRGVIAVSSTSSPGKTVSVSAGQIAVVTSSGVQTRRQTSSEQSGSFVDLQSSESLSESMGLSSNPGMVAPVTLPDGAAASDISTPDIATPDIATPDINTPDITPVVPSTPVDPNGQKPKKPDPATPQPPAPSGSGPAVKIIVK